MNVTLERFDQAATHARDALAVAPDDPIAARSPTYDIFRPDAHHLRGLLADDPDEAVPHLERAFQEDPSGVGLGADLAVTYVAQGRPREALGVIAEALEHHPDDERLLELRARVVGNDETAP